MADLLKELNMPNNFADLQLRCPDFIKLSILQSDELNRFEHSTITGSPTHRLGSCHILKIIFIGKDGLDAFDECFLIGNDDRQYRSSSRIIELDPENNNLETQSGSIYSYKELLFDNPDSQVINLCATLNHFGMRRYVDIPDVFF